MDKSLKVFHVVCESHGEIVITVYFWNDSSAPPFCPFCNHEVTVVS